MMAMQCSPTTGKIFSPAVMSLILSLLSLLLHPLPLPLLFTSPLEVAAVLRIVSAEAWQASSGSRASESPQHQTNELDTSACQGSTLVQLTAYIHHYVLVRLIAWLHFCVCRLPQLIVFLIIVVSALHAVITYDVRVVESEKTYHVEKKYISSFSL